MERVNFLINSIALRFRSLYSNFNTRGGNGIMNLSHMKIGRNVFHVEIGVNLKVVASITNMLDSSKLTNCGE